MVGFEIPTVKLYKDCLRVAKLVGGNSKKGILMKDMIRKEFRKNINITDKTKIEELRFQAIKGLNNYLILQAVEEKERKQT